MTLKDLTARETYYRTKSYLSQRTAVINTNTVQVEGEVSKGIHEDHAADQDFGISNTTLFLTWNLGNKPKQ